MPATQVIILTPIKLIDAQGTTIYSNAAEPGFSFHQTRFIVTVNNVDILFIVGDSYWDTDAGTYVYVVHKA